jgi:hypothetical protein
VVIGRVPLRGDADFTDYTYVCLAAVPHPSDLHGPALNRECTRSMGKNAGVDVEYADVLAAEVEQALNVLGCRDSVCAMNFGGPHADMRATASPVDTGSAASPS